MKEAPVTRQTAEDGAGFDLQTTTRPAARRRAAAAIHVRRSLPGFGLGLDALLLRQASRSAILELTAARLPEVRSTGSPRSRSQCCAVRTVTPRYSASSFQGL